MHEGLGRRKLASDRAHKLAQRALADHRGLRAQHAPDALGRDARLALEQPSDLVADAIESPRSLGIPTLTRRITALQRAPYGLHVQLEPTRDLLLRHPVDKMKMAEFCPLRHSDHLLALPSGDCGTNQRIRLATPPGGSGPERRRGGPFSAFRGVLFQSAVNTGVQGSGFTRDLKRTQYHPLSIVR